MEYRWRIWVRYESGRSHAWPCEGEAAARAEYAQLLAERAAGEHPNLGAIAIERQWITPWRPVEAKAFCVYEREGGR